MGVQKAVGAVIEAENDVDEALRLLGQPAAFLFVAEDGSAAGIFTRANAYRSPIARPSAEIVAAWRRKGWLDVIDEGATRAGRRPVRGRFRLNERGRAALSAPAVGEAQERKRGARLNETPLSVLERRRDASGERFLRDVEIAAGERLAADVERAESGGAATQNWSRFLACVDEGPRGDRLGGGASASRARIEAAMKALGPGLADVALRVCGFCEGLEKVEKSLGWPARSGKIVLKLSLERLAAHYGLETTASDAPQRVSVWRASEG